MVETPELEAVSDATRTKELMKGSRFLEADEAMEGPKSLLCGECTNFKLLIINETNTNVSKERKKCSPTYPIYQHFFTFVTLQDAFLTAHPCWMGHLQLYRCWSILR